MVEFREKYLLVDKGITISYSDTSAVSNQKPVLIFLHGLGGDLAAFNDYRKFFLKYGYRSLAIDLRGHGLSTVVKDGKFYDFNVLADDVLKILEHEKVSNYVLIGHCFGSLVAQNIAIRCPVGLTRLVLINSTPITYPLFKKIGFSKFVQYLVLILEKLLPTIRSSERINHDKYLGSSDFNFFRIINDIRHTSLASYGQILSYILNFNSLEEVSYIKVPTLILSGSKDKIFATKWSKILNKRITNSKLIEYQDANHLFLFTSVEYISSDILQFLQS